MVLIQRATNSITCSSQPSRDTGELEQAQKVTIPITRSMGTYIADAIRTIKHHSTASLMDREYGAIDSSPSPTLCASKLSQSMQHDYL